MDINQVPQAGFDDDSMDNKHVDPPMRMSAALAHAQLEPEARMRGRGNGRSSDLATSLAAAHFKFQWSGSASDGASAITNIDSMTKTEFETLITTQHPIASRRYWQLINMHAKPGKHVRNVLTRLVIPLALFVDPSADLDGATAAAGMPLIDVARQLGAQWGSFERKRMNVMPGLRSTDASRNPEANDCFDCVVCPRTRRVFLKDKRDTAIFTSALTLIEAIAMFTDFLRESEVPVSGSHAQQRDRPGRNRTPASLIDVQFICSLRDGKTELAWPVTIRACICPTTNSNANINHVYDLVQGVMIESSAKPGSGFVGLITGGTWKHCGKTLHYFKRPAPADVARFQLGIRTGEAYKSRFIQNGCPTKLLLGENAATWNRWKAAGIIAQEQPNERFFKTGPARSYLVSDIPTFVKALMTYGTAGRPADLHCACLVPSDSRQPIIRLAWDIDAKLTAAQQRDVGLRRRVFECFHRALFEYFDTYFPQHAGRMETYTLTTTQTEKISFHVHSTNVGVKTRGEEHALFHGFARWIQQQAEQGNDACTLLLGADFKDKNALIDGSLYTPDGGDTLGHALRFASQSKRGQNNPMIPYAFKWTAKPTSSIASDIDRDGPLTREYQSEDVPPLLLEKWEFWLMLSLRFGHLTELAASLGLAAPIMLEMPDHAPHAQLQHAAGIGKRQRTDPAVDGSAMIPVRPRKRPRAAFGREPRVAVKGPALTNEETSAVFELLKLMRLHFTQEPISAADINCAIFTDGRREVIKLALAGSVDKTVCPLSGLQHRSEEDHGKSVLWLNRYAHSLVIRPFCFRATCQAEGRWEMRACLTDSGAVKCSSWSTLKPTERDPDRGQPSTEVMCTDDSARFQAAMTALGWQALALSAPRRLPVVIEPPEAIHTLRDGLPPNVNYVELNTANLANPGSGFPLEAPSDETLYVIRSSTGTAKSWALTTMILNYMKTNPDKSVAVVTPLTATCSTLYAYMLATIKDKAEFEEVDPARVTFYKNAANHEDVAEWRASHNNNFNHDLRDHDQAPAPLAIAVAAHPDDILHSQSQALAPAEIELSFGSISGPAVDISMIPIASSQGPKPDFSIDARRARAQREGCCFITTPNSLHLLQRSEMRRVRNVNAAARARGPVLGLQMQPQRCIAPIGLFVVDEGTATVKCLARSSTMNTTRHRDANVFATAMATADSVITACADFEPDGLQIVSAYCPRKNVTVVENVLNTDLNKSVYLTLNYDEFRCLLLQEAQALASVRDERERARAEARARAAAAADAQGSGSAMDVDADADPTLGRKFIVACDSKRDATKLRLTLKCAFPCLHVLQIDGDADPGTRKDLAECDRAWPESGVDVVIHTSVISLGVSFTQSNYFGKVFMTFTGRSVDVDTATQMMKRARAVKEFVVHVTDIAQEHESARSPTVMQTRLECRAMAEETIIRRKFESEARFKRHTRSHDEQLGNGQMDIADAHDELELCMPATLDDDPGSRATADSMCPIDPSTGKLRTDDAFAQSCILADQGTYEAKVTPYTSLLGKLKQSMRVQCADKHAFKPTDEQKQMLEDIDTRVKGSAADEALARIDLIMKAADISENQFKSEQQREGRDGANIHCREKYAIKGLFGIPHTPETPLSLDDVTRYGEPRAREKLGNMVRLMEICKAMQIKSTMVDTAASAALFDRMCTHNANTDACVHMIAEIMHAMAITPFVPFQLTRLGDGTCNIAARNTVDWVNRIGLPLGHAQKLNDKTQISNKLAFKTLLELMRIALPGPDPEKVADADAESAVGVGEAAAGRSHVAVAVASRGSGWPYGVHDSKGKRQRSIRGADGRTVQLPRVYTYGWEFYAVVRADMQRAATAPDIDAIDGS